MKDKLPLQSKKFLAYLIADLGWKALMFYVVWEYKTEINQYAFMVLVSMIVTAGFIQIGYILGQAFIDRYVMIAMAAMNQDDDEKPTPPKTPKKEEKPLGSPKEDEYFDGEL